MDLLQSLNLDDLPEQQTRTVHLLKNYPDFDLKLGFDSCCSCGKEKPTVECESCHRVKYCSKDCRTKDSSPAALGNEYAINDNNEEEEEEQALGHTSVICALLGLCNDDEMIEGGDDSAEMSTMDKTRRTAATDRLVSEFESYPATLANVIMEGPCYQKVLESCSGETLTIHVIGASEDSELWKGHPDPVQEKKVFAGYADALAEIAENYKLHSISLEFFGPECPKENIDTRLSIPPVQKATGTSSLNVKTFNKDYKVDGKNSLPNIVVFFNPGFTCPDYDWESSLSILQQHEIPFLVTTNTEMEAMADIQFLHDRGIFVDIPAGLKGMFQDGEADGEDEDEESDDDGSSSSFFSLNPYAGLRVRQSGTMANDLYVKSRWIFGGISCKESECASNNGKRSTSSEHTSSAKKKQRKEGS
ncbi:MAG: hypothetical protein SGARI_005706, partial [Bacillariaceae sp.]